MFRNTEGFCSLPTSRLPPSTRPYWADRTYCQRQPKSCLIFIFFLQVPWASNPSTGRIYRRRHHRRELQYWHPDSTYVNVLCLQWCHRSIPFLSSRIPQMYRYLCSFFECYVFAEVNSTDRHLVGILKQLIKVLVGDWGLADTSIPQKHCLDLLLFCV